MKRLLQLGLLLGFAGTLAAAHFLPWVEYERYRSEISTVANGGRVEEFVVRLPADRIGDPVDAAAEPDAGALKLEHFKLRDAAGNVIGLAARHELTEGADTQIAWLLTIPSRGSIALAASASGNPLATALAAGNLAAGESLAAELAVQFAPAAESVLTSGEFADIDFELVETWVVTGLDDDGRLLGTLRLKTTGRAST